jgi:hypothetical protein
MSKTYSGFQSTTAQNLLLDAGAFFFDFEVGTDTFDSAVAAGKLAGATRGGGRFVATPSIRAIQVDGVKGRAKGLQVIDSWDVSLSANVLEVSKETLAKALAAGVVDDTGASYSEITANNYIETTDYIDNVTWVGKISGNDEPVIIQVYNALNVDGLTLETQDANEAVIAMKFDGHYDTTDLDAPPFKIFYPKP